MRCSYQYDGVNVKRLYIYMKQLVVDILKAGGVVLVLTGYPVSLANETECRPMGAKLWKVHGNFFPVHIAFSHKNRFRE